jgi:multiple sugar transport system ATP-binding protein
MSSSASSGRRLRQTTILRLMLGLETPDEGEILIGGKPVNAVSPAERNVAMVFQNLALFPHMSARDNMRFPLVERKVPPRRRYQPSVSSVAEKLHIGHILHKPPAQLSGGERQRVAIARALVRDPAAYLMDDPISALDARLREETRVELKRLQQELGHTLVYVTHDQEEAMSVADRMAILDGGVIRQVDTPRAIYDRPASRYVARLVGAPTINLLTGTVDTVNGRLTAASGVIRLPLAAVPDRTAAFGIRPESLKLTPWRERRRRGGDDLRGRAAWWLHRRDADGGGRTPAGAAARPAEIRGGREDHPLGRSGRHSLFRGGRCGRPPRELIRRRRK